MDLILWRHAEAEEGLNDIERKLTPKGRRQASKMAKWLREHLPEHFQLIVSPAVRTRETAKALAAKFVVSDDIGIGANPEEILRAAGWPRADQPVVIVGHQPTLGVTAARLLAGSDAPWSLRKGAFVWVVRKGSQTALRAALSPDLV